MSSTQVAMCGSQSETQIPLWPCCFHFRCEARSGDAPFAHGRDHRLEAWRQRLAGQAVELGLRVERIEMARPPFHEQEDDALGRRRAAPWSGDRSARSPAPARRSDVPRQQVAKRKRTEAGAGLQQPVATGQRRHAMRDS